MTEVKNQPMVVGTPLRQHRSKEITKCLNVLVDICRLYGFVGSYDLTKTQEHWDKLASEEGVGWKRLVKYKLVAFFSAHTPNQPSPVEPFQGKDLPGQLFGGRLGRFIQVFMKRHDLGAKLSFLASIKQAKKGMPRADVKTLKKAEDETVQKLTGEPPTDKRGEVLVPWDSFEDFPEKVALLLSREEVEKQLRRTVKEIFSGKVLSAEQRVQAFFPSTSANYINNRKGAGAVGSILEHPTLLEGLRREGGYIDFKTESKSIDEEANISERIVFPSKLPDFEKAFTTLWLRILQLAKDESQDAEPVALAEPLKERVITKGPPFTQTALRCVWRYMFEGLTENRAFQLIKGPVTELYLLNVLGLNLKENEGYLSGDYEGATNNLKSWVSEVIANAVADEAKLYPVERRLFIASLTRHKLRGRAQTTGQLMGSVTSFPVLCLANAALSRWAYEISSKRTSLLRDCPLMVNGDDLAMRCTSEGYRVWKSITQFAGLKESIGKTYFSNKFVEINSTIFGRLSSPRLFTTHNEKYELVQRYMPFKRIPFVNMGLLYGIKRSGGQASLGDQLDPMTTLGVRYRDLVGSVPVEMRASVHRMFVDRHRDLLNRLRVPWYLPEWIGGLGLTGVVSPSELDLRLARVILYNWKENQPRRPVREVSWRTWSLAQAALPKPFVTTEVNSGVLDYRRIVGKKCIDLLFDSDISLETLFEAVTLEESRTGEVLRYNARLWSPKSYTNLPIPLDPALLEFQARYDSYESEHLRPPRFAIDLD
jgi:hypothetical protein